jgi:hypothetical protein
LAKRATVVKSTPVSDEGKSGDNGIGNDGSKNGTGNDAGKSYNGTNPDNGIGNENDAVNGGDTITVSLGGDSSLNRTSGHNPTTTEKTTGSDAPKKRGRPPKKAEGTQARTQSVKTQTRRRNTKVTRRKEAEETVALLLTMADTIAQTSVGPDAAMNIVERMMIEPSLTRLLENTSDVAIERAMSISTPLILAVGVGMWGLRVNKLIQDKQPDMSNTPPVTSNESSDMLPFEYSPADLPSFDDIAKTLPGLSVTG